MSPNLIFTTIHHRLHISARPSLPWSPVGGPCRPVPWSGEHVLPSGLCFHVTSGKPSQHTQPFAALVAAGTARCVCLCHCLSNPLGCQPRDESPAPGAQHSRRAINILSEMDSAGPCKVRERLPAICGTSSHLLTAFNPQTESKASCCLAEAVGLQPQRVRCSPGGALCEPHYRLPHPGVLIGSVWDGAEESASLSGSQVLPHCWPQAFTLRTPFWRKRRKGAKVAPPKTRSSEPRPPATASPEGWLCPSGGNLSPAPSFSITLSRN